MPAVFTFSHCADAGMENARDQAAAAMKIEENRERWIMNLGRGIADWLNYT